MKKNLFFVALAAIALVACDDKNDSAAAPEGSVKMPNEQIAWDGMQTSVAIDANCEWTLKCESEFATFQPMSGNADTKVINVSILPNTTNAALNIPFSIEFKGANGETKEIHESILVPEPSLTYGDVTYKVVYLKDGKFWMAENLRYVPENAVVGEPGTPNATIFYPAVIDSESGNAVASKEQAVIEAQGYLYLPEYALGVSVPEDDTVNISMDKALCPKGWHIPTAREWTDLVGASSFKQFKNENAPYYEGTTLAGGDLAALNADGFNLQPYSYVSKGSYFKTVQNATETSPWKGMVSMCSFLSSTTHKATTMQVFGGQIMNLKAKTYVTAGYVNLNDAVYIRLVKD